MKNVKEITIEVKGEDFDKVVDKAFNKKKKDIKLDGFRKGAVTKEVFLKRAGIESLYMDIADIVIDENYKGAVEQAKITPVCEPNVSIEAIDKNSITVKYTIIGKPEVKLGDYKKLGIKKDKVSVSKEEIEHEIDHILEHMSEVVIKEKGKVEVGNTAVIDFDGVVDGKALEGGSGKDYALEIGSHSFIPGFEEGVEGMKVGETKVLNLKFPEEYVENLKGKDVEFTVTVKEIKERIKPELNADLFEDLGIEGVDSKESLEKHVKDELTHSKEHQANDKYLDELLHKATDNMTVDINPEIIDSEVERMIREYAQQLQMQGISFEQYLSMTGTKMEDVQSMMKPQAMARIKTRYLLEEIVAAEKIKVTESEIKDEVKSEAEKYGMKEDEFLSAIGGEEAIKYEIEMKKALDIVKEG